ncbi:Nn.00g072110.m01.CDS01 [Neocucurbitaria sp. VM-36]
MATRFKSAIFLISLFLPFTFAQEDLGTWSPITDFPIIPVAACIIPEYPSSSRLMVFSAWSPNSFGGEHGVTQFAEYNYVTGAMSTRQVAETQHDMFCPGMGSLADGRLVITGGSNAEKTSIYDPASNTFMPGPNMRTRICLGFTDRESVFVPELFDPASKTFTELAPEAVPRNYHSVSILLADGTVFSGGGGLCWDDGTGLVSERCRNTVDHPNGQIFTPPYLTTGAARPVITNLVSSTVAPGGELRVAMEGSTEGVQFSLIRIGSVTHNINTDQRRVPLMPSVNGLEVVLPLLADSGVMLPGAWYLFAVSSEGVPSVARTVYVTQV